MSISLRTNPVFKRGEHSANPHLRSDTGEVSDWLAHQFRQQSAKEISEKTGQGQRAAEAVKMGCNGLTMAHLVNICRAFPNWSRRKRFTTPGKQAGTIAAWLRPFGKLSPDSSRKA